MNSQNHENADGGSAVDRILDDADARMAQLKLDRAAIAQRRRALAEPAFKTVVANPTETHHKITLGAVMANIGLAAADADAVAGLLATNAEQVIADAHAMMKREPGASFGAVLIAIIDRYGRQLSAAGLYETWCRRLSAYQADSDEWLARDEELRLAGAWRELGMIKDQQWLIRVTCRIRRIDMPGNLSRGSASEWLAAHGANLTYQEFVL